MSEALPKDQWIARCLARMQALDPVAPLVDLEDILGELAERVRWRECEPEAAADLLFGPITADTRWPSSAPGSLL